MNGIPPPLKDVLIGMYFSQDARERELVFHFLGELAMSVGIFRVPVVKLLMKALIDKDIHNKCVGVYYLGELGKISPNLSQHIIYPLIMILMTPDIDEILEFHALNALEKIDKSLPGSREFLQRGISDVAYLIISKLDSGNPGERMVATWKLGKMGKIYFPAILDLIPIILRGLLDEDEKVKNITFKFFKDLFPDNKEALLPILHHNIKTSNNLYLKLEIMDLLNDFGRKEPAIIDFFFPLLIHELGKPNRQLYLKIHRLLRIYERRTPECLLKHKTILVDSIKSKSRYAYHWAVKAISSVIVNNLRKLAAKDYIGFTTEAISFVELLMKNENDNLMQSRVILLILVHEAKVIIESSRVIPKPLGKGIMESLEQIQKSHLISEAEVVSAYEKYKQILHNSTLFISQTSK
ncbi:MAG: hypothetical protein ACTSUE_11330 [Promethearchaeota archaeon]